MDSTNNAYTFFPDSIPYNFSDIGSWATLFLDKKTSQLIAVTNYKSEVKIYSLAYTPLSNADVIQNPPKKSTAKYIIILVGVLLIIGIFILKKRLKKKSATQEGKSTAQNEDEMPLPQIEIQKRKSKASIYFLGGFQVFDKEGNDISAMFSPTLKQLFIIILLYMIKNGRGISTLKLNETLWFDKTDSSARNNRNVSISKLRALIAKVGEMDIVQESAYWRVQMDGVYSDYVEAMSICENMRGKNTTMSEAEAIHFVQIAQKGEMLPNIRFDWIDDFKADFSNNVIDTLLKLAALPAISPNNQLIIHIADAIFKYDSINEDAIALKCAALCRLGKKGLAKTVYESFAKEYNMLLGTAFDVPFNELII
jgi:two-component SAPR family response regulator